MKGLVKITQINIKRLLDKARNLTDLYVSAIKTLHSVKRIEQFY